MSKYPFIRASAIATVLVMAISTLASISAPTDEPSSAAAAPKPGVYQAMGAPSDPKVEAHWNRYHDHAAATKLLQELAKVHSKRAKLQSLGKSYGGREMWVITIANFERGGESEKPAFWIDGGIHANEIQAVEVPLYTAWYLLEMYGRNEFITRLVDERVFYILPMLSPDSRDAHFYKPNTTHSPRTGQRPVDDDRDGRVDEDGPDDLDGDGNIVQMRIRDPNGKLKPHPDYPEWLVSVKPGEKGEFTIIGSEGFDNDGDGRINEDGDGSYDPNRDWAWNWQPGYVQGGAHHYPFSILENRIVADFIMAHPNIAGAQSYHNAGGMILRGPGAKDDRYEPADTAVYQQIAQKGERILPGYRSMNIAEELYEVYGGSVDWLHMMHGTFTFTNELFTPQNFFRQQQGGGFFGPQEQQLEFNKLLLFDEGLVKWHKVKHPQYGEVEVGGLKKNWVRQPPSFLLEEECHRNMAFTLYHADQMPKVKVLSIDVKPQGGGLAQVTAAIENQRLIPTRAASDVRNKVTPADRITIAGQDLKVITGMTSSDVLFRQPTEQLKKPADLRVATLAGHGVLYARWLVQGAGPYTVTVKSIKGGQDIKKSD